MAQWGVMSEIEMIKTLHETYFIYGLNNTTGMFFIPKASTFDNQLLKYLIYAVAKINYVHIPVLIIIVLFFKACVEKGN